MKIIIMKVHGTILDYLAFKAQFQGNILFVKGMEKAVFSTRSCQHPAAFATLCYSSGLYFDILMSSAEFWALLWS